jgi:beta-glucuronidase
MGTKGVLLRIAGLAASVLTGGLYYLFKVFPRFDYGANPAGIGAKGTGWEIDTCGGTPFLLKNGIPFPSGFDASNRPEQALSGPWLMRLDPHDIGIDSHWERLIQTDDSWKTVDIPSTFNAALSEDPDYTGPAWFFLKFVPNVAADDGYWLRLCLEGILLRSRVWLNGKMVSEHEGGWTPQYAKVSHEIKPGAENIIIVRADNRLTDTSLPTKLWDHHSPGWHSYGGIFRDVFIERIPNDYIFKADYSCVIDKDKAELKLDVLICMKTGNRRQESGGEDIEYSISGPGKSLTGKANPETVYGRVVKYSITAAIDSPGLWSPETPNLYNVILRLGHDEVLFKAGLRTIEVKGTDILLNGKKIFLKGISKHEDHPALGASQTPELIENDIRLIKEMGANYIRLAHYPHHAAELKKARDMGLMLAEEIPLYQSGTGFVAWYADKKPVKIFPWRMFGNKQLINSGLLANAQRQLAEMIERDRLNPAIIMWGVANETYTLDEASGRIHGWLADTARALDRSRPVTMAELTYDLPVFDERRMAGKYMDIISVNIYSGWYYGKMEDVKRHMEKVHERFSDKPVIISECGAEAAPGRSDKDGFWIAERVPPGKTYSEDYQERLLENYVRYARSAQFIAGISPWVFADFFCPEFPSNPVPYYNSKGIVSKDRIPKKSYYMLKRLYHEGF